MFEKYKVNIVWSGHVHNYQRSFPMKYDASTPDRPVFLFDRKFDGAKNTKTSSPIYIVTGAGGAGLYNAEQQANPADWQPFTAKYVADRHSFTFVEARGEELTVRQIAANGDEVDRFVLTK